MTVVPARVKTLTSTTEMAIGSVSNTDTRARRTGRPPPGEQQHERDDRGRPDVSARTNAPMEPTVAMTAFVSGLSR